MRTETVNAIKALLYQGDTTGNPLPPELVETLRYYEDAIRAAWLDEITPREIVTFIVGCVEAHREDPRYEFGQKLLIPSREQEVWFVRHAPWGCIMVRDSAETRFLILESRVTTPDPEPPEPARKTKKLQPV